MAGFSEAPRKARISDWMIPFPTCVVLLKTKTVFHGNSKHDVRVASINITGSVAGEVPFVVSFDRLASSFLELGLTAGGSIIINTCDSNKTHRRDAARSE